jgi:hypothetical protein
MQPVAKDDNQVFEQCQWQSPPPPLLTADSKKDFKKNNEARCNNEGWQITIYHIKTT